MSRGHNALFESNCLELCVTKIKTQMHNVGLKIQQMPPKIPHDLDEINQNNP
jgi:hypothetical protein